MTSLPAITPEGKRLIELGALISDLELLEGPCREMDARIAYLLDDARTDTSSWREVVEVFNFDWPELARQADSQLSIWSHVVPRYTASTDAALALTERVLERPLFSAINSGGGAWYVTTRPGRDDTRHSSLAIAICIATLRAKAEEKG